MPMAGANFREGATPEVLLPRIPFKRTSENPQNANFAKTEFYEVRMARFWSDAYNAKVLSSQSYATRWKRTCAPPSQWPSAPSSAVNTT